MLSDLQPIDKILREELGDRDYELVKASPLQPDGRVEVQALKLQPLVTGEPPAGEDKDAFLYIPIPVTLQLQLDSQHRIINIQGDVISPEVISDACHFAKMLLDNHQVGGLAPQAGAHTTHQIEINDKGQKVIRRKRFS